jgi:hypothetical protein
MLPNGFNAIYQRLRFHHFGERGVHFDHTYPSKRSGFVKFSRLVGLATRARLLSLQ